jgi:hypothetical protein
MPNPTPAASQPPSFALWSGGWELEVRDRLVILRKGRRTILLQTYELPDVASLMAEAGTYLGAGAQRSA